MTPTGFAQESAVKISDTLSMRHNENVTVLDFNIAVAEGFKKRFLLSSDRHWDNPKTNLQIMRRHLDEAKATDAHILDFGDFFCAMQGKGDPRGNKSDIRPEHNVTNYLDALVDTADEWFAPYADRFLVMAPGNHEGSVFERQGTDLNKRLVEKLNARGSNVVRTGMSGWVVFKFTLWGNQRSSKRMAFHHGYGGAAPVTKGTIQTNRMAVYLPDADIVVTGHTHGSWLFPIERLRLSDSHQIYKDRQMHVKLPSYKDAYGSGKGGWEITKGMAPTPIGAYWMEITYARQEMHFQFTEAL